MPPRRWRAPLRVGKRTSAHRSRCNGRWRRERPRAGWRSRGRESRRRSPCRPNAWPPARARSAGRNRRYGGSRRTAKVGVGDKIGLCRQRSSRATKVASRSSVSRETGTRRKAARRSSASWSAKSLRRPAHVPAAEPIAAGGSLRPPRMRGDERQRRRGDALDAPSLTQADGADGDELLLDFVGEARRGAHSRGRPAGVAESSRR